ncbi:MAG: hypothetical protein K8T90_05330 [Planctomycetes bacterium]|nr:hypothetical protein [Planctomycetota bacterium]
MKHATSLIVAVLLAAIAGGCKGMQQRFVPYTAGQSVGRLTKRSVQFYEGDIATVLALNPTVIGTVIVSGNGRAKFEDCERRAAEEAALRGGTHFVTMDERVIQQIATVPGYSHTTSSASAGAVATRSFAAAGAQATSSTTSVASQTYTTQAPVAQYRVLRIEWERWGDLPRALQPVLSR